MQKMLFDLRGNLAPARSRVPSRGLGRVDILGHQLVVRSIPHVRPVQLGKEQMQRL
jgi:hypothetical protein